MNTPDERDSPPGGKSQADARRERLARQLRANLKRRKAQSKARHLPGEEANSPDTGKAGEDDRR